MVEAATEQEKRAVRVLCDFGEGPKDAGTGVAIRDGLVLTARHVLYKEEKLARSVTLIWTYSSAQSDPLPAQKAEGCECSKSDLAVLRCDTPPHDIATLPIVAFAQEVLPGAKLLGDGFPILTDSSGSDGTQEKCTLECNFIGSNEGFMTLMFNQGSRFSQNFKETKTADEVDRAFAGSSGTGLFDQDQRLSGVFLARLHKNTTDTKAAFITTALAKFRSVIFNTPECDRITQEIERISENVPELHDITEIETLAALSKIGQVVSERTRASCHRLACLVVARGCDREEIQNIKSLLDDRAHVIDVLTTKFGGVERRIASAEDRPVAWRDLKADPLAEYRLVDAPDAGIDGVPVGTDFIGAIGVDLNHRLDDPFVGAPQNNEQMHELMADVISELKARLEEREPRYYYAARNNDKQINTRVDQVSKKFEGLVPFFRLQNPPDAEHDRKVLRALLKIMNWKPSA